MLGNLRLAWRNLGRNLRRTLLTGAALAIGVALSVVSYGVTDGFTADILRSLTRFDLGHVQVHRRGYPQSRAVDETIPDADRLLAVARAQQHVVGASPRAYGYALVSHGQQSEGAELVGIDPANEPRITTLDQHLVAGGYLDPAPTPWPRGRELTAEERARDEQLTRAAEEAAIAEIEGRSAPAPEAPDVETRALARAEAPPPQRPPGVLVGAGLARTLRAKVGDELHITAQAVDGVNEQVTLQIAGVYRTGTSALDRSRIYLHVADLQHLMHLYGRVHELAIAADDPGRAPAIVGALEATAGDLPVVVRSWSTIRPDIQQLITTSQASLAIMVFIILFVASLGVVNTMLMAVFERTRELGVLKALGMSGGRVVGLVVLEALLLVLGSCGVGTVFGFGMDLYLAGHGLDLTAVTGGFTVAGVGIAPVLHGAITAAGVAMPTIILSVTCVLASLYPAIRAARLRPAVGMRET